MSTEKLNSLKDLVSFVDGSQKVAFAILGSKQEKYQWLQTNLISDFRHIN